MADEMVEIGKPIPKVGSVVAGDGLTVHITWADGRRDVVDLSPLVLAKKWFAPLRHDRALFERVEVEEYGAGIRWSDTLDIANYTLERLAEAQRVMSTDEFNGWRSRHGLTLDAVPAVLGVSRRTAADMASGRRPMDLTTTLACRGYDAALGGTN